MQTPQTPHPASPILLFALCALYLLIGVVDHDLWKMDDAVHLGVAWGIAQHGFSAPLSLAGEAWSGAPLYHWLAAALGKLTSGLFQFHNAARFATVLFMVVVLVALGWAASVRQGSRPTSPRRFDWTAPLLLIGTPGLLLPAHEAQPMIAVLAGHALCYCGLALMSEKLSGALILAGGLLVTLLAGGITAVLPLLPLALLVTSSTWRSRSSLVGWTLAAVALVAGGFILKMLDLPAGLGFGEFRLPSLDHFELLAWHAWPVWPIALWSIWLHRRQWNSPAFMLAFVGSIGSLIVFLGTTEPRNVPALPVLIPLALLATTAISRLRRGAANALDWFGMLTFTVTAALVWVAFSALHFGVPGKTHEKMIRFADGMTVEMSWLPILAAVILTLDWLLVIYLSRRSPWRGVTHWAGGVTLTWALVVLLLMPLINHGKSYRGVAEKLAAQMTGEKSCIVGLGLNDAHRAVLNYHGGIQVRRTDKDCRWLLMQSHARRSGPALPDAGWDKVMEAHRPGERQERFYLYQRKSGA